MGAVVVMIKNREQFDNTNQVGACFGVVNTCDRVPILAHWVRVRVRRLPRSHAELGPEPELVLGLGSRLALMMRGTMVGCCVCGGYGGSEVYSLSKN